MRIPDILPRRPAKSFLELLAEMKKRRGWFFDNSAVVIDANSEPLGVDDRELLRRRELRHRLEGPPLHPRLRRIFSHEGRRDDLMPSKIRRKPRKRIGTYVDSAVCAPMPKCALNQALSARRSAYQKGRALT